MLEVFGKDLGKANGGFGPRQTRIFRSIIRDKAAPGQSVQQVLAGDSDQSLVAHGEPLAQDGKATLAAATAWLPR